MFKFFDRYVLREIVPPFFVGLVVYSFVLVMNQLLQFSELFIARGVSLSATLKLLLYIIPAILAFTVPMSVLMGILAGLGRLSTDSEITAFKTLGVSHLRMLRPLLLFAFGGWLLTSLLTLYLAPASNFKWIQTVTESVLDKVQLQISPREFNESFPQMMLYIQDIGRDKYWENIFIYFSDPPEEPRVVFARKGRLNFYAKARRASLELYDIRQHSHSLQTPDKYSVASSAHFEEEINIERLYSSYAAEKRAREKNIGELFQSLHGEHAKLFRLSMEKKEIEQAGLPQNDIRRLKNLSAMDQAERDARSYKIEIHKKFALPFVCWIFVFLGMPLGVSTKKGGRTSGFTLSLVIILVYYILITAGERIAMEGRISPFLGIWGGNIILMVLSVFLFFASSREWPLLSAFRRRPLTLDGVAPREKTSGRRLPRLFLPFPNILDRYIIRKYMMICALAFMSLIAISVIVTFFDRIGSLYIHNKPLSMLLTYIYYRLPEFIHFGLPVTALTATLLTLGLFTKFNEITAMKASGISIYRAILPVLAMALVLGALAFHIQEQVLPLSSKKAEEIWNKINDVPLRSYGYVNRRWVANKRRDRFYYYTYFDPGKTVFSQLSIFDINLADWTLGRWIYAEKAWLKDETLHMENCWIREFGGNLPVAFSKQKSLDLRLEEGKSYFLKESKEPSQMTYGELRRHIREVQKMGFDTNSLRVDLNSKISFPFVALIMTLLGIPFAFSMGKRGTLVGIGIGLAIVMIYWVVIGVFRSLGYVSFLNAFLAAWGPNLIFGLIGLYLLFRLRT